jgi:LysM repeat protein
MSELTIPNLGGTVGGGKKAKNDSDDVKIVQGLLNDAVDFGGSGLDGFPLHSVDGKVDDTMLAMIQQYQLSKGLGPPPKPQDVLIEPGKGTIKSLAQNPYADARWSEYDTTIKGTVDAYNTKFRASPGYVALDWRLIKAQVWTEVVAGPDDRNWYERPMQIGRFIHDTAFKVIRNGLDHSELVTDKSLRDSITADRTGANNIRAGIAYDVHLNARYANVEVIEDAKNQVHTVEKGETVDSIAKAEGTTVENLMTLNSLDKHSAAHIHLGQKLTFQKAHHEWKIVGWKQWMDAIKAYNQGGDAQYLGKITDNLAKIKKRWK